MENMTMEERLAALEARVAELEQLVAQNKQNIADNKKHIAANKGLLSKLTNEETSKMSEYMQAFLEPAKAGVDAEIAAAEAAARKPAGPSLMEKVTNAENAHLNDYMKAFIDPAKAGAEVEPAAKTEGPSLLERMTEMATERNTVTTDAWLEQVGKKSNE